MTPKQRVAALIAAGILGMAGATLNRWEGNEARAYRDIAGIVTACRGVTGPGIELGRTYTAAECAELNDAVLLQHLHGMGECANVDMPVTRAAAFLSFTYNIGVRAFCTSTAARKLRAGDQLGACREMLRWVNAGGRRVAGLENRRRAEFNLCMRDA